MTMNSIFQAFSAVGNMSINADVRKEFGAAGACEAIVAGYKSYGNTEAAISETVSEVPTAASLILFRTNSFVL
jgi:hypothetical protein